MVQTKDESYEKEFAPITLAEDGSYKRAEVMVDVQLKVVLSIDEVSRKFQTQATVFLIWKDYRLKYINMKRNSNDNLLTNKERNSIWIPKLIFDNTNAIEKTLNDDEGFILTRQEAKPKRGPDHIPENFNIYDGKENSLVIARPYDTAWICDYDMRFYPFDTQRCTMELKTAGNTNRSIKLMAGSLSYLGPKDLTVYFIRKTNMFLRAEDEAVVVEVTLGRRLMGTVLTVYIPTLLMMFISQCTNYFKAYFFEAIVSVNLTVMLVLATMFLSVSQSLPKTSYIKMVDVWLLFNLFLPFCLVVLHTRIDMLRSEEERTVNHHGKERKVTDNDPNDSEDEETWAQPRDLKIVSRNDQVQQKALKELYAQNMLKDKENRLRFYLKVTKFYIPLLVALFIFSYWAYGLSKYSEV